MASDRLPIRRRRFQFSLASLLAGTAVAACATVAVQWFVLRRRAEAAEYAFVVAESKWEAGTGLFDEYREASSRWLDAESAVPFSDQRAAQIAYLNRTVRLEKRITGKAAYALFGSEEALHQHEQWALQMRAQRERLESELGIKAEGE